MKQGEDASVEVAVMAISTFLLETVFDELLHLTVLKWEDVEETRNMERLRSLGSGSGIAVGPGICLQVGDVVMYGGAPIGAYAEEQMLPAERVLSVPFYT
ncbi:quinone oxidoreductase [Artemisia annua]|uniref:Quinone oxidoreductase n=1 Tax=Artemisia annua TaxID=35608 RepID=A0A2U1MER3_ARTAN|nr:quinone oxidoreductase [Artemisia annua]